MKTYSIKSKDIDKQWLLIDAKDIVLGRLAAIVANRLRGKHKPTFTPHMDMGDHVVVINARHVLLTGNKRNNKTYYRHTGYPGGIKAQTARTILEGAYPERVVTKAVQRMLPGGPLSRKHMTHLRVFADATHCHQAQKPQVVDIAALNAKNHRS